MTDASLTVAILREIRDEARKTNERLDATNERLDATNERLDATNERLDVVAREQIRIATAVVDLEKGQRVLTSRVDDLVVVTSGLGGKIDELGARIDNVFLGPMGTQLRALGKRVLRLERHVGLKKSRPH
jgi:chromosome segregation ATPase